MFSRVTSVQYVMTAATSIGMSLRMGLCQFQSGQFLQVNSISFMYRMSVYP